VKVQTDKRPEVKRNESKIFAGVTAPPTLARLKEIIVEFDARIELHPLIK